MHNIYSRLSNHFNVNNNKKRKDKRTACLLDNGQVIVRVDNSGCVPLQRSSGSKFMYNFKKNITTSKYSVHSTSVSEDVDNGVRCVLMSEQNNIQSYDYEWPFLFKTYTTFDIGIQDFSAFSNI